MRVAKVAQKEPMETVRCLKLEKLRRRSSRLCNVPGVCSSAHVLCKVVKKYSWTIPGLQDLLLHTKGLHSTRFGHRGLCNPLTKRSDINTAFGRPLSAKLQSNYEWHLLRRHWCTGSKPAQAPSSQSHEPSPREPPKQRNNTHKLMLSRC